MTPITLALDWTPNANHVGFLVAREKGFYREEDLDVTLIDPSSNNYAITPAKRVELGRADLALCPTESLISYRTKATPIPLIGIAALHREDLSAIVVLEKSGIETPHDLDGKIYASYKARYEDGIVRAMIRNDGGRGAIDTVYPDKLGIWDRLLSGQSDATWIFCNWMGVQADNSKHRFRYFRLADYGIPYGYSPVIAGHADRLAEQPKRYRKFLVATKRGHLYARENPAEAADILLPYLPPKDRDIDLDEALARTLPHLGTADDWGTFDEAAVQSFLDWIAEIGLEERRFSAGEVVTGRYLERSDTSPDRFLRSRDGR